MIDLKRIATAVLLAVFMMPLLALAQEQTVPNADIPQAIQKYIQTHFPNQSIVKAKVEMEGLSKEYEIKLNDRTELEFDGKYQIKKIDGKSALPSTVIPAKISDYVRANYPNNVITDWEIEWNHQEVELDNGLELEFTMNGEFIRIDY